MFLLFPDLSFHCVTFEPDNVNVVVSEASNQSAKLGTNVGTTGVAGNVIANEATFDIEFPSIFSPDVSMLARTVLDVNNCRELETLRRFVFAIGFGIAR